MNNNMMLKRHIDIRIMTEHRNNVMIIKLMNTWRKKKCT